MNNELTAAGRAPNLAIWPANFSEASQMAKIIANTELVPKDYKGKPDSVLVAIQMGLEVGLAPMQALQSIAVINGRPAIWGDAVLALVRASGLLESISERMEDGKAICTVKRRGDAECVERLFSRDDATKAALWGKAGPWQQYPRRMLQMRARSWALRDTFPDVLKGLAVREEVEDYDVLVEDRKPVLTPPRRIEAANPPPQPPENLQKPEQTGVAGKSETPQNDAKETQAVSPKTTPEAGPPTAGLPPAQEPARYISEAQRKRLFAIGHKAGWVDDEIKRLLVNKFGIASGSTTDIQTHLYESVCNWLVNQTDLMVDGLVS